ncbi:MAG: TIGR01777 family oxidoreductase [candidate division FCPU426 bacterium]
MKIAISGSSGMIGQALVRSLSKRRHEVWRLLRGSAGDLGHPAKTLFWDPEEGHIDPAVLEGFDAVIHLGGLNLASQRWDPDFKKQAWDSRVLSSALLAKTLAGLKKPPAVFFCASAVGIYGDRGPEALDEASALGNGYLAELCRAWEAACDPARNRGIRVVHTRFGVVLAPEGGVLKKMLPPFRLGLGGGIGSGKQWVSWIALPDLVEAFALLLEKNDADGPYVFCSPNPVSNANFTKAIGRAVARPAFFRVPAFAARLAFGEMADQLLLASQKALPRRLKEAGYKFQSPYIGETLGKAIK